MADYEYLFGGNKSEDDYPEKHVYHTIISAQIDNTKVNTEINGKL